ncbi:hypothetical protein GMMP15_560013 [Candidatus Magnetomoraceae bacterium gMMP-15]
MNAMNPNRIHLRALGVRKLTPTYVKTTLSVLDFHYTRVELVPPYCLYANLDSAC